MSLGIQSYGNRTVNTETTETSNEDKWTFKKVCTAAVQGLAVATFATLMLMRRDLNHTGTAEIPTNLICGAAVGLGFIYCRYFHFKDRALENYVSNLEKVKQMKIEHATIKPLDTQNLVEIFLKNDAAKFENKIVN